MKNEVFVKINADGSRMQAGMINAIDFSEQINAVMMNRQEMKQQHQDRIDALRFDALRSYCASSAYEKSCHNEWIRHSQEAINKTLGIPQRYFEVEPAQERNTMEVSHLKYKIIKPAKYCKLEVSKEDADFVNKAEAVYLRGGKESLKSKLCFELETFIGKERAEMYRNNELLAPFRSAGHVQILRDNLNAVRNVIFYIQQNFGKSGSIAFHAGWLDTTFALRNKINKSIEEYEKHAG